MRKIIVLLARLCGAHNLSEWRQYAYNVRHLKRLMRAVQMKKRGGGGTKEQKEKRQEQMVRVHQQYMDIAQQYLDKACLSLEKLQELGVLTASQQLTVLEVQQYMVDAERQIDQITRRVVEGKTIPHNEKVFSIFEPHTEWIVKGKAGVPMELGLRVCIMEDQHQFLLHHQVMEKQTDDQVAVSMVCDTKQRFSDLATCSFDKGFHSPENQEKLAELLDIVALPRKGKQSKKIQEIESSADFLKAKKKHSAVESAINGLDVHGLDRCPDRGLYGFKRYVALSIVGRNLQRLGVILIDQELRHLERAQKRKLKEAA
jgi:IS5 family transposase